MNLSGKLIEVRISLAVGKQIHFDNSVSPSYLITNPILKTFMVRGMRVFIRIRGLLPNKLIFAVKNNASSLKSASNFRAYEIALMA